MNSSTTLPLPDGANITVPNSLNLLTTYVLTEQEDWFEEEIKFLRQLIKTGQKVIDVGANYGVYTLTLAKLVGHSGHVWSFEPASKTAAFLGESIASNDLDQVTLAQQALSDSSGSAALSLHENSEMNALSRTAEDKDNSETVTLVKLDDCMQQNDWDAIDFIKLDAEGEELKILEGGHSFFTSLSPLVQYEVKEGSQLHLELTKAFSQLGYASYRLVPGLDVLVPFNEEDPVDDYLLNLFCCKHDRAEKLASEGVLVTADAWKQAGDTGVAYDEGVSDGLNQDGISSLVTTPYGMQCAPAWKNSAAAGLSEDLVAGMSHYALSQDSSQTKVMRLYALQKSLQHFQSLCDEGAIALHLASLARVAKEYGFRSIAVKALRQLSHSIFQEQGTNTSEPFLAPTRRFESVVPSGPMGNWVLAATLEALTQQEAFSSYYTGEATRPRLLVLSELGYSSAEMQRRLKLINLRFPQPEV